MGSLGDKLCWKNNCVLTNCQILKYQLPSFFFKFWSKCVEFFKYFSEMTLVEQPFWSALAKQFFKYIWQQPFWSAFTKQFFKYIWQMISYNDLAIIAWPLKTVLWEAWLGFRHGGCSGPSSNKLLGGGGRWLTQKTWMATIVNHKSTFPTCHLL